MKKVLVSLLVIISVVTCVTGCGKKEESKLTFTTENTEKILEIKVDDKVLFEGLDTISDNTLETILGINRDFVEKHAIVMSKYIYSDIVAVIKPKGKNLDTIKLALDLYSEAAIESYREYEGEDKDTIVAKFKNPVKEEYKGYYIYIVSDNSEEVLKQVKSILK